MKHIKEIKREIELTKERLREIESDYAFERISYKTYINLKSACNGIIDALEWVLDE